MRKKVLTPRFRAAFVNVFKPRMTQGGKEEYSLRGLFEKGQDLSALNSAIREVSTAKWGDKAELYMKHPQFKSCLRDQGTFVSQETGELYAGFVPGNLALVTKNTEKPAVTGEKPSDVLVGPQDFNSGDYARASIELHAWENKDSRTGATNRGVTAYLLGVQRWGRGESLSGRTTINPEKEFSPLEVDDASELFGDAPSA